MHGASVHTPVRRPAVPSAACRPVAHRLSDRSPHRSPPASHTPALPPPPPWPAALPAEAHRRGRVGLPSRLGLREDARHSGRGGRVPSQRYGAHLWPRRGTRVQRPVRGARVCTCACVRMCAYVHVQVRVRVCEQPFEARALRRVRHHALPPPVATAHAQHADVAMCMCMCMCSARRRGHVHVHVHVHVLSTPTWSPRRRTSRSAALARG